jgi:electron transfer flavoprotein alpha/beta subunit
MVAENLGVPQITYVREFYEEAGRLIGIRKLGAVDEKTAIELPCVAAISKQKYRLRGMTLSAIRKTLEKEVCIWNLDDICEEEGRETIGLARTAVIEIKKIKKTRKKKIVSFEDCQKGILSDIIREVQKCGH